jgi:signal transduction histidine kinase
VGPLAGRGWTQIRVPFENELFLAVATVAETPDGRFTIVVARTTDVVGDAIHLLTSLLAAGLPLLLLMVALTTWKATGRALRPVESIRGLVEEISAAELHRRVPSPPGDDEINRLGRTMNRMLDRLEQAQIRQRRLVSDASHELRSPVASILHHAEVAEAHPDRTTTAALAGTVLAEGMRVQRLIEDLLVLARADEHTLQVRRRPLDLDDLVFEEAGRLRQVTHHRIDTAAVSAGRVSGDAASLRRVLRNLGDNAARHARGQVSFALRQQDGTVLCSVADDGPGIPEPERERVLERFVRLDDARARDAGGSGLGLALVAELIAAHGGTVTIGAGAMGGAEVELRLPGAEDHDG